MANIVMRLGERYTTRTQDRLVERLRAANAIKPANATLLAPLSRREARLLERMVKFRAVVQEGEHLYWLNEQALVHFLSLIHI